MKAFLKVQQHAVFAPYCPNPSGADLVPLEELLIFDEHSLASNLASPSLKPNQEARSSLGANRKVVALISLASNVVEASAEA